MFLLALRLGRTVAELEHTLSYNELIEWRMYFEETHFGELRADRRNAELLAMTFNVNRSPKQTAKTSDDFMAYKVRRRELSDDDLEGKIDAVFGGLE
ncbi:phage tail assembly protein T [Agitococcus lubricus]|uniref:Minor tail T domain-containing protein n=1 Tax=Agitococcus lubricus TaxID=1077255 RepID=A0A2T5J0E6_9GAMM|nr:hypothetical protein [Agitococcus lubricus]PTQ89797.1 hypothetical protein C8N29_105124 [Agitococcus lubricus]